jgi:predicted transposase YbfD/YdcC
MNLSTFDQEQQGSEEKLVIDPESLYKEFEKVRDGRKAKGRRYPLALLLTLIMMGKMAGETTINGIVDWIKERKGELKKQLSWPKRFPTNATYSNALANCNDQEVVEVIRSVFTEARAVEKCEEEPSRLVAYKEEGENLIHTALDGKVLRGTQKHTEEDQPKVHLLALYEPDTGIVIAQEDVKEKENEITGAKKLLDAKYVKGRITSADAMHTQKDWCAKIHALGGYYLLVAKDNQKNTRQDLVDFFSDKDLDNGEWEYYKKVQKGHGRLEVREIWVSTQMNGWFEKDWAGIAQVFKIRRWVKQKNEEREEIVYGFTNLKRRQANAESILDLNQKHWSIENRLHYRRDVTLGEDACQVRINGAPKVLAALNGGVLTFMDFLGVKNVASQMRHFCKYHEEMIPLLFGKLSRQFG